MPTRNALFAAVVLGACTMAGLAHAQQSGAPAYGMLFQKPPAAPQPQDEPLPVLRSRPVTQADVDAAVANVSKPHPTVRTPTPMDLARMPLPTIASATPATFEEQQAARQAAWQAQEEQRIEYERQVRLAQEAEARKTQVVVVQKQEDPWLSNILAIPRAFGYLFGGRTVR